jgi:hypothetical protein
MTDERQPATFCRPAFRVIAGRREFPMLLTALLLLLPGCGTPRAHTSPPTVQKAVVAPGARLTEATAIQVGVALARQKGINLKHYEPPEVRFDSTRRQWRLFYMEKPPGRPGGHFTVTVDDQTMEAQFHGGA